MSLRSRRWMRTGPAIALLAVLCGGAAARRASAGEGDGPVLEGMHPVGQIWVGAHGGYAEGGVDVCRSCHGADLRGSAFSRTAAERVLDADDYGHLVLWAGFQVGCWACHAGPDSERPSTNRAPQVADAALTVPAGGSERVTVVAADADGDALELRIVVAPAQGVARVEGGDIVYSADASFAGEDVLRIAAWDGFVDSNLAAVFVSVGGGGGTEECAGDCDGDGRVAVSELVTAVRLALGVESLADCPGADANTDGVVAVGDLVRAVRDSLRGCGPAQTATPTPTTAPPMPTRTGAVATPTRGAATPTQPAVATPSAVAAAFAALQRDIFTPSCATAFCHDSQGRAGGLNLAAGAAYAQLVGVAPDNAAARTAGLLRVSPGMPEASFLLQKLTGPAAGQGFAMPPGGSLSAAQVERVRAWIASGAQP